MIQKNKRSLLIASLITLLPAGIGALLWNRLPDTMATHWGVSGAANGFSGKAFAVFGLPLILLGIFWLCIFFTAKDPNNKEQNKKALGMVIWIIPLISCFMNAFVYAIALGIAFKVNVLLSLMLGLLFTLIGNYIPKCKQNFTLGIKIRWTLSNEENWNKTHRLAGKLWFFGGLLMILCAFLPTVPGLIVLFCLLLVMLAVPLCYSYGIYWRQKRDGTYSEDGAKTLIPKNAVLISLVTLVLLLGILTAVMFTGRIHYTVEDTSFTVSSTYYGALTVSYGEIDSVEYRSEAAGTKTNGFNNAKLLLGNFQNDEFGDYLRYTYRNADGVIILRSQDRVLVLSDEDEASTKALYESILAKIK